ncbi:MAG: TlpA disulfide reductase family protein [Bacteroidota bacterium]
MKAILSSFFLFLLTLSLAAQDNFTHLNEVHPVVKGQLLGYDTRENADLQIKFNVVQPSPNFQKTFLVQPDDVGYFELQLPHSLRYQQVWFSIGDHYFSELILDQGLYIDIQWDDLTSKANSKHKSKAVTFKGKDGELNEYLRQYNAAYKKHRSDFGNDFDIITNRSSIVEEKREQLMSHHAKRKAFVEQYIEKNPSPYSWLLMNDRLSEDYGKFFLIYSNEKMSTDLEQKILAHRPKLISNSSMIDYYTYANYYFKGIKNEEQIGFLRDELLPVIKSKEEQAKLHTLIDSLQLKHSGTTVNSEAFTQLSRYFREQYEEIYNQYMMQKFLKVANNLPAERGDLMKLVGGGIDVTKRRKFTEQVIPTLQTTWAKSIMQTEWQADEKELLAIEDRLSKITVEKIDSPFGTEVEQLPDGATLFKAQHQSIDSLLAALRYAYPDKTLLLDLWATWCGPCIMDMRESAENIDKLQDMDVEVIYLCTTRGVKEKDWKNKVAELNLNAPQIYLNDALSKEIMTYFDLSGYPSKVLRGKDGKYLTKVKGMISDLDVEEFKEMME